MEKTSNIPNKLPILTCADDIRQIKEWMAGQPFHDFDTCVNRGCRWTYSITDQGIFSHIVVKDNGTGETFTPFQDPDLF